jgi:hypothetical protein
MLSYIWSIFGYSNEESPSEEPPVPFPYKRINHFKEFLEKYESGGNTPIPDEVMQCVKDECKKMRMKDKDINYGFVKYVLRKNNYNKYYHLIPNIIQKIGGGGAVFKLTKEEKQLLCDKFEKLSEAFDKLLPEFGGRKNFLGYSYVTCKLCDANNITVPPVIRNMPKGLEKMMNNEKIYKKLCEHLGWNFIAWQF